MLYGYTCERCTWHVYLKDRKIYTVIYKYNGELEEIMVSNNHDFIPDKRVYPAACDYEFCHLLLLKCIHIPFTNDDFNRESKQYYGEIL